MKKLMGELRDVKALAEPNEILLVVDAMIGQKRPMWHVSLTNNSSDRVILTKIDGDTRGGAALSVRQITGKPIKFTGTGEKSLISKPSTQTACLVGSSVWGIC